jgi:hypothetical protein
MSTVRKLVREAVIFMLFGLVVGVLVAFVLFERSSAGDVRKAAARAVYAHEAPPLPAYRPDPPWAVQVPLTNGILLFVTDCNKLHPSTIVDPKSPTMPGPAGTTNGSDCVYFKTESSDLRWHLVSVPLGDENQIAIEKEYWAAYAKARRQHLLKSGMWSLIVGLWGFPAGLGIWVFYRLVRFAVKG